MNNPSLAALPAIELRRLIGTKEISPVELLEACIARDARLRDCHIRDRLIANGLAGAGSVRGPESS